MEAERQARQDRQQAADARADARPARSGARRAPDGRRAAREGAAARASARSAEREKRPPRPPRKYEQLVAQQQHELERVASLTADEAKELLLKQIEGDARHDAANLLKRLDAEARETAVDRAKQYITEAIQRCAAEHAIETTVSVVDLPSDDLKGRIIGREGRNIRALELATGVDLIVDDTPGAIILSGFDPYRREIAKQAIERLIADGRIHPARIEEVVQKVKDETDEAMRKEGAAVAFELGLHDLHPEILRLMGRLKYRTSYGQNVLSHSAEVARLAGIMAQGSRPRRARRRPRRVPARHRQGDRSRDGRHAPADRHRLPAQARRERSGGDGDGRASHGHRLAVARGDDRAGGRRHLRRASRRAPRHPRVLRQAPREARRASPTRSRACRSRSRCRPAAKSASWSRARTISDEEAVWLSKDIARRIENELEYPGQIKVTVIRETRAVDYAK